MAKAKKATTTRRPKRSGSRFKLEWKNAAQKLAWIEFQRHEIVFLVGPAGVGKTHLAMAFAISEVLEKKKKNIILTRPIVEAGESLGYLPGEFENKVHPFMLPCLDIVDKMTGGDAQSKEIISNAIEVAPVAYMRGRALLNSENVVTPSGLKPIGEIEVGEYVIGKNGKPTKVVAVYPQGNIPTYEIKFSDHTKSICCENHLWFTMTLNEKKYEKGYTAKTTLEIIDNVKNKHNQKVHRIPICESVEFDSRDVKINPYLLGILLGDGSLHKNASISVSSKDVEIIEEISKHLPENTEIKYASGYDYRIVKTNTESLFNPLKIELNKLDLLGKKSNNKFIPSEYKFNSKQVRLEILRGLMDADGWICKHRSGNCRIQYSTISKKMCEDVKFIVRSLGGLAYSRLREYDESDSHELNDREIRHVHNCYVVDILMDLNPFKLSRKAEQYENNQRPVKMISSIKQIGEGECTCITVDAEDNLFLTEDFIVTHNTFDNSICIFDEAQNATKTQLKLFLTRFGEDSKLILTGDPKQSDLAGDVALLDVIERLQTLKGIGMVGFGRNSIVRHKLVGEILERLEDEED
tara:strand:- start:666 stop:2405 length:1740 start_codon:yes stop_codon:yes gene_type:complete